MLLEFSMSYTSAFFNHPHRWFVVVSLRGSRFSTKFDLISPPGIGVDAPKDPWKKGEDENQEECGPEGWTDSQVGHNHPKVCVRSSKDLSKERKQSFSADRTKFVYKRG